MTAITPITYTAVKCPCGMSGCRSGNLRPVTHGQGVMQMEEAEDLARMLNAYPKLLAFTIRVNNFSTLGITDEYALATLRREAATLYADVLLGEKPPLSDALSERTEILAFVQRVSLFSAFDVPDEDSVAGLRQEADALFEKLTKGWAA